MFPSEKEERKKRETQEVILWGKQSRDAREKEEQECDTGGRAGGRRLRYSNCRDEQTEQAR